MNPNIHDELLAKVVKWWFCLLALAALGVCAWILWRMVV